MKRLLFPIILALALSGCTIPFLSRKNSGLKVTSSPEATVILDGQQLGTTPLETDRLTPGKHRLVLSPITGAASWETEVTLNEKLQTVVDRQFGASDSESEDFVLSLEKTPSAQSQLSIVTIPDRAIVRLNGQPKGFSPVTTAVTPSGTYEITISSAGYKDKKIPVLILDNHRLLIAAQLARAPLLPSPIPEASDSADTTHNPQPSRAPTPSPKPKNSPIPSVAPVRPYVEIAKTGTTVTKDAPKPDWLRVRQQASQSSEVVSYVYAGETYKFLDSTDAGWYQIELPDGKTGWISGQYAKLYR
jgi:hypothetical protein